MTDDVTALRRLWQVAEHRGDTDVLDNLLADDFIGVDVDGARLTKQQWLDRHRTGQLAHTTYTVDDETSRTIGDAAIVVGRLSWAGQHHRQRVDGGATITWVAAHTASGWHVEGIQLTPVQQS